MQDILVNKAVAANSLSISIVTLDRLVRRGEIVPTRVGPRRVMFRPSDLRAFAARCRKESK